RPSVGPASPSARRLYAAEAITSTRSASRTSRVIHCAQSTRSATGSGVGFGDDGAGQLIQAGRQDRHGIGAQERAHQQVAVLGEGAPLPAGKFGLPGHAPSITRPPATVHLVFRREKSGPRRSAI